MTNNGIQNGIIETGEPMFTNDNLYGNKKLLNRIDELADEVLTSSHREEENLIYSSYITRKFSPNKKYLNT